MWNSAKQHKSLIQQHSFWEIKNGSSARFWEDSWQHMPALKHELSLIPNLMPDMHPFDTVGNFCRTSSNLEYREWLRASQILR